jgi:hypothetical protein
VIDAIPASIESTLSFAATERTRQIWPFEPLNELFGSLFFLLCAVAGINFKKNNRRYRMPLKTTLAGHKQTFKLKPLTHDGVDAALTKAEHYRLLNQPKLAESICLDILEVEKDNQKASIVLLLSLTDQFGQSTMSVAKEAQDIAFSLKDEYSRVYYMGIIHERQGNVALNSAVHGSDFDAYEWYLEAMDYYEQADAIHPTGNDDPKLRWNTCARTIMQFNLQERPSDSPHPILE